MYDPTMLCPPDGYAREHGAPAHRHDERCRPVEPLDTNDPVPSQGLEPLKWP